MIPSQSHSLELRRISCQTRRLRATRYTGILELQLRKNRGKVRHVGVKLIGVNKARVGHNLGLIRVWRVSIYRSSSVTASSSTVSVMAPLASDFAVNAIELETPARVNSRWFPYYVESHCRQVYWSRSPFFPCDLSTRRCQAADSFAGMVNDWDGSWRLIQRPSFCILCSLHSGIP